MMADEVADQRVRFVRVTNNTAQMWTDSYDGVPVFIEPGKMQQIPLDMAAHFFGWHPDVTSIEMMHHLARRRGWYDPKYHIYDDPVHEQKLADEVFKDLIIEPVTYKLVEERPNAPATNRRDPVPALTDEDLERMRRMKEPTSVKDKAAAGMVEPDEEPDEPRAAPYRGTKPAPPKRSHHGRKTEGD
jgi:hypothetical protein